MRVDSADFPLDDETRRFLAERVGPAVRYVRSLTDSPESGLIARAPPTGAEEFVVDPGALESPVADEERSSVESRYVFEGEIATGGNARILDVFDRSMQRLVAMKVLRQDRGAARGLERLREEARATGQLEHPNIPPVYDLGEHPDHGVYFTMRLVRGRSLAEILRDASVGRLETLQRFSVVRLVQILQQVAMGVHYAHVRGVVHRDLKPDNIMVGDYGEVLVMDWGIAKISREKRDSTRVEAPVLQPDDASQTTEGAVTGTLSYMSPEQARGWTSEIDERSDVFGLGAVLYEILTFHPPYEGKSSDEVLLRACSAEIVPPRERAPRNHIPPELESICLRSLSASKDDRHPDAMAFHEDLQVFLEGTLEQERKRAEAAQLELEGKQKMRRYLELAEEERRLTAEARRQLESLTPQDSYEQKIPAWELLERAETTKDRRIQAFSDSTAAFHAAINIHRESLTAAESLADLYWNRFEEAERAGNRDEMAIYRRLVERYEKGKYAELLKGEGRLTLVSEPPGARVSLRRLEDGGWRLVEHEARDLGETPLRIELAAGFYIAEVRQAGFRTARVPLCVERATRPLVRVHLYTSDEIGEGFLQIPEGECLVGGDSDAPGSLPRARKYVADFFAAEFPVTFRQYCEFLDALRQGGPDARDVLRDCVPRTEKEGQCARVGADDRFEPDRSALNLDPATVARHDESLWWNLPVIGITWDAATRYARWLSVRDGRRYRLPRDAEWEKMARGACGFIYPWGSRFDWSLVKGGLSRPERPELEPVGSFPTDRSVHGVRDLAGTVREWCRDWFLAPKYRLVRGSAWVSNHPGAFRCAQRSGISPDMRSSVIGFRLVSEPPRRET